MVLLCQVPGVSVKLAAQLRAEFGTAAAMYGRLLGLAPAARVGAFAALPGIGRKKAEALEAYLFS